MKLQEIFDKLDDDHDGEISAYQIDTSCMCLQLVIAFKPLFDELESIKESLNKEIFVDAAMRLYDTLPQSEKNLILNFDKNKKKIDSEQDKCTFQPRINFTTAKPRT